MIVQSKPKIYTDVVLGRSNAEYRKYIVQSDKWGGALELAMLSEYYGVEIAAIDIESTHLYIYGEGKDYKKRAYLVYTGIHYDVLVATSSLHAGERTLFDADDELARAQVISIAEDAKQNKQYTNTLKFTLMCEDCSTKFVGTIEATEHAKETGHRNFVEAPK
jgi:ubiquitin thioesterase OTU1